MIFLWALATILVIFIFLRHFLGRIVLKGLEKKAILITGCDSGFGFELALKCLSNGMRVFGTFLTEKGMKEMEEMALKLPGNFDGFEMDVRNDESVQKGLEFVESKLGNGKGLFALVNNAGIVGNVGWDDWLLAEDYEQVWQVNALGTIRVTQTFKKLLKMEKGSRIILMASTCGRVALPGLGPYSVSKYAIEAYGDTIRTELIIFGIKVAIIEPGFFRTPLTNAQRNAEMLNRIWERTKPEVKAEYGQALYQYSMNRLLTVLDPSKLNSNIGLVVDAYWHAITSAWPKRRYQVGADIKLFFLPFSFLPAELQDIFYQIVHFFQRPPIGERNKKGGETNDGFSKFIVK